MGKRTLWLIWYSLFILCALLGFIPDPEGFWKFCFVSLSILFFVPGFWLLVWADRREDVRVLRQVRTVSILWLAATTVLIGLNFASALMTELWGNILYGALIVVSSPMVCGQYWVLSLFGWACILFTAIAMLKKRK